MLFSANVNQLEKSQITFREKSLLQEVLFMSTHLHMSKMPLYMVEVPNSEIAEFYDKIISCSSDVPEDHKEYIQYQIH